MERPAILNRSMPAIAGATISVLPARTISEAFQRDIPSRGIEVIYIFERRDTRDVYLHAAENSIGPQIRYNPPVSPPSEGVVS
jgi:hypothetical protein